MIYTWQSLQALKRRVLDHAERYVVNSEQRAYWIEHYTKLQKFQNQLLIDGRF